jgi:hypothetical protein
MIRAQVRVCYGVTILVPCSMAEILTVFCETATDQFQCSTISITPVTISLAWAADTGIEE